MTEGTRRRLEKAARSIDAARRLMDAGDADFAVERAYYAMFYTAEALLYERGLDFGSHGAVHGAFGKHFAKTGTLDPKYHGLLLDAFRARQESTYDALANPGAEQVEEMLGGADSFLAAARGYLEGEDG